MRSKIIDKALRQNREIIKKSYITKKQTRRNDLIDTLSLMQTSGDVSQNKSIPQSPVSKLMQSFIGGRILFLLFSSHIVTTQKVQEAIHILQTIDPADPGAYDKAVEGYKHIGQLPFFIFDFPDLPKTVFHTRTHDTDNFFENFSDISLPPEAVVKSFARCNVPHQPVFYCSDFRPTSYLELLEYWVEEKKEEFLHATIGKWTIENSLKVLIVTSPHEQDRLSPYDKMHGVALDHFINQQNVDTKAAMILLYKFLFDKFRKPAKKDPQTYIITSAYCNMAFNQNKDTIDAILYPSVPYDGKGINLAIKATYPFQKNMNVILVARDTFKRINNDHMPTFQHASFKQAKNIDHANMKIVW